MGRWGSDGNYIDHTVELMGRNAEEMVLWNALAITTTSNNFSQDIDLSTYDDATILIRNTHDQALTLRIQVGTGYLVFTGGNISDQANSNYQVNIPANSGVMAITKNDIDLLAGPIKTLKFFVFASTVPTTGSVSATIIRRKR